MNGIRKLAFHAARYNRQKYLDSDVRSRPLQSVRRAFFSYRTVVILHREQPHPRKPYRGIQRTSSKDSPARIFVVARQQRAVPLYAEKFFGIRKVLALRGRAFSRVERLFNRYHEYRPKTDKQKCPEIWNTKLQVLFLVQWRAHPLQEATLQVRIGA